MQCTHSTACSARSARGRACAPGDGRAARAERTDPAALTFVYIHILWFACWIAFGIEDYPFGLLSQILQLTLEVRSYAAAVEVQRDHSQ